VKLDFTILSGYFANPLDIIRNLLDIIIVAYIFYRLLSWIKGTRAEQLLKGLVILLLFSATVSLLHLSVLKWLLDKLWIVFAITLPIVFQPELRRILEQLGRGRFFLSSGSNSGAQLNQTIIGEIVDAAKVLSRNKVGALIIICRENDIEEYLETGVAMDSLVSAGLLINIFVPNTPLHDGAVIIKNGRIQKAACFLPLSNNPLLDPQLGTRHRSGIGISEVSDALAVIVSEETGAISLAKEGKLQRYLDDQSLKEILEKELKAEETANVHFWRRWSGDVGKP